MMTGATDNGSYEKKISARIQGIKKHCFSSYRLQISGTRMFPIMDIVITTKKTYGKLLLEHHHQQNRPCTYPTCFIHQSRSEMLIEFDFRVREPTKVGLSLVIHKNPHIHLVMVEILPIVNDEGCYFF